MNEVDREGDKAGGLNEVGTRFEVGAVWGIQNVWLTNPGSVESSKEWWLLREEGNDIIRYVSQEPLHFLFCFQFLGFDFFKKGLSEYSLLAILCWIRVHSKLNQLYIYIQFSSVPQSCPTLCTPWTTACQASLSITNSRSLFKLMSIELVMPSNHLILCRPLLLLPSIFPRIRVFSNESALYIRWPKYWSFSFIISPSSEHPELISFRMDWLDLLAVQGTLKSLLQHHSSKASILWHWAFFIVQLSHPYMTTGKTINHSLD